ncbi:MAG: hypothetical protein IT426_13005 [Pirellulales bacterium]|nr:hypothetical protein [Pirellulales bacterium]
MFQGRKTRHSIGWSLGIGIGLGVVAVLMIGGVWPQTPLHATATDRVDSFAMSSGLVDENVEAVYFLDFLTGDLNAVVMGRQSGHFTGYFKANVAADMGIDNAKNPRYMMITGTVDLRRSSRLQYSQAVVYVAEVTSGKVAAYAIPWSSGLQQGGQGGVQPLIPIASTRFRNGVAGIAKSGS